MSAAAASHPGGAASWVERIPYDTLDLARVRDDTVLFHMVSSASLIEFASGVYTRNLVEFFHDDDEVVNWLTQSWEKEELQHGEALKRYVQTAWPDLDWESAYEGFIAELVPYYSVDRLARTRALEMVGRCVVESGTATFYRMMSALASEPVLKRVAKKISADEVRHYKHFYRYYLRYREIEKPGRRRCCACCGRALPRLTPKMSSMRSSTSCGCAIRTSAGIGANTRQSATPASG